MPGTKMSCPECSGVGNVHASVYERTLIPHNELAKERAWRSSKLNTDLTCKVTGEAVKCRVCFGLGYL